MTTRCLECKHLGLKQFPRHANEGLGKCKLSSTSGQFISYMFQRECGQYERAEEGAILKRLSWHDQLKMFRKVTK